MGGEIDLDMAPARGRNEEEEEAEEEEDEEDEGDPEDEEADMAAPATEGETVWAGASETRSIEGSEACSIFLKLTSCRNTYSRTNLGEKLVTPN